MPANIASRCGRLVIPRNASFAAILHRTAPARFISTVNEFPESGSAGTSTDLSDESNLQKEKKRLKKVRTQVWASRLERETLGESSSVLILRDAEKKKTGHILSRADEDDADDRLNVNQILKSINGQNLDPEQQDVNQNIDSVRPVNVFPTYGRVPCISLDTFNELVKSLCNGFNHAQLDRYITIEHQKGRPLAMDEDIENESKNITYSRLKWHMLRPLKSEQENKLTCTTSRGKRGLANRIIRTIWGFEVQEEIESEGRLQLQVDPSHLGLILIGGATSALRELSIEHNLKIGVNRNGDIVTLSADKYKCLEVAESIERLLRNVYTVDYDLQPFKTPTKRDKSSFFFQQLSSIASKFQCAIEEDLAANKLVIRSRDKANSEHCQRILTLALLDLPHGFGGETSLLSTKDVGVGSLYTVTHSVTRVPSVHHSRKFGRFSKSYELPNAREPPSKRFVPRTVIDAELSLEISSHILQCSDGQPPEIAVETEVLQNPPGITDNPDNPGVPSSWTSVVDSQLFAETGHILHEMNAERVVENAQATDLLNRDSTKLSFCPLTVGLPQFLLSNFHDATIKRKDFLRVRFIPSPWFCAGLGAKFHIPNLEMNLGVDFTHKSVYVDSLEAIIDDRTVAVMLPEREFDVRFFRKNVLYSTAPNQIPAVSDYIQDIQASALGYGNIKAPLFLRVKLPKRVIRNAGNPTQSIASSESNADEIEVEFMSTGIEYEESLLYDFKGHELAVRSVGGGEFAAKYSSLLLHCNKASTSDQSTSNGEEPSESVSLPLGSKDVSHFTEHTSLLLRELGLAYGNMNLIHKNPQFADMRKSAEREADMSARYRSKMLRLDVED